jgi:hypothetical protein
MPDDFDGWLILEAASGLRSTFGAGTTTPSVLQTFY